MTYHTIGLIIVIIFCIIVAIILRVVFYRNNKIVAPAYRKAINIVHNYNTYILYTLPIEELKDFEERKLKYPEVSTKDWEKKIYDFRKWDFKGLFPELAEYECFYDENVSMGETPYKKLLEYKQEKK